MNEEEYVDLGSTDWGDSLDDADGESYESYYYEPRGETYDPEADYDFDPNKHINCPNANPGHCGRCCQDDEDPKKNYRLKKEVERDAARRRAIERDHTNDRRLSIMCWLHNSGIARGIKGGIGFYVNSGPKVKLKNNHIIDILKWLFVEGICPDRYIAGYFVEHCEESEKYPEKLLFYEVANAVCGKACGYKMSVQSAGSEKMFNFENEGMSFIRSYRSGGAKDESTPRQKDIVKWLLSSKYTRIFKHGGGFYITRGAKVKLKNGSIFDIVDWLLTEGIANCKMVSEYNVKHVIESEKYKEAIYFFKVVSEV